jgi:membrane protein DedA with SNARE-associated domain
VGVHALQNFMTTYGYYAVFLFAFLESACIPIPSEITFGLGGAMCSSAFLANPNDKHLNLAALIVVGIIGEVIGSLVAYMVGKRLGRTLVDRYGRILLLTHKDLDTAERWFDRRGALAVLVGRILPVIRAFISLPAGVAEMNLPLFTVLTAIGTAVWATVLAEIGYHAAAAYSKDLKGLSYAGYLFAAGVIGLLVVFYVHRYRAVKAHHEAPKHGKH